MDEFWAAFVPQLLASLAAAIVGIVGVLVGFWLQRRAARRDAVDTAAANVVGALGTYAAEIEGAIFAWSARALPGVTELPKRVQHEAPTIALDLLLIASQREEREVARMLVRSFKKIRAGGGDTIGGYRWMGRAVTRWRAERLSLAAVREELEAAEAIASGAAVFEADIDD
jgi:hypothetical protein